MTRNEKIEAVKREIFKGGKITSAFENTNFGENVDQHKLVLFGLLERAIGFAIGDTLRCILIELGLLTNKSKVSAKGYRLLRECYSEIKPRKIVEGCLCQNQHI